jgi:hypothetical protein
VKNQKENIKYHSLALLMEMSLHSEKCSINSLNNRKIKKRRFTNHSSI